MATASGKKPPRKKTKSAFARSAFGQAFNGFFKRLFAKRSIIIIAEHKTQHIPFTASTQFVMLAAVGAIVAWASYSSGSYMAAQRILEEKERKLANSALENKRVTAEFDLLRSDLMKLASSGKGSKISNSAKMLAEQYASVTPGAPISEEPAEAIAANDEVRAHYEAVFKRIEFLDNKVKELQANHDEMVADIRATTGGKIRELEKVIAGTGVEVQGVERAVAAKREQEEQRREKYGRSENAGKAGGQGGPFEPVRSSSLKSQEPELYFNLQRMMTLHEALGAMPIAAPLAGHNYRQTSSFGGRIDPFRRQSAFHSGVDLAGPDNAKVLATSDGKVEFAGWKSAYGNMVDVKHQYGLTTRYAHLARVLVQPEQYVKKGQVIGIQGSTGRSTGHHLHYEVRYQGRAINPSNFLKAGEHVRASN